MEELQEMAARVREIRQESRFQAPDQAVRNLPRLVCRNCGGEDVSLSWRQMDRTWTVYCLDCDMDVQDLSAAKALTRLVV